MTKTPRLIMTAVALLATLGASGLAGRQLASAVRPAPQDSPAATASGYASIGRPGVGTAAGPVVPNPDGRPDLTADPAAKIAGTPPSAGAPRASFDPVDATTGQPVQASDGLAPATAPASGTTVRPPASPAAASVPAPGSTPSLTSTGTAAAPGASGPFDLSQTRPHPDAFTDPCLRDPRASGCPQGIEGTILGDTAPPELRLLWAGEIRRTDVYAGECARQFPTAPIDWNRDSVFAVVVNMPVTGTTRLQLFHPQSYAPGTPTPGSLVAGTTTTSAELVAEWARAFAAGARTPTVPLCLKVPPTTMDANRAGCLATWTGFWWDCRSRMELSLESGCHDSSTDPLCAQLTRLLGWEVPRRNLGPLRFEYSYDPQWSGSAQFGGQPLTGEELRRRVELVGVDPLNLEVRVPLFSRGLAEADLAAAPSADGWVVSRTALTENQLVAAAGYPVGTDCRAADPTTVSTILPVTRQGQRTRYYTPDPAKPALREGVVNLTMPRLAPGEGVTVCVYWYTLPSQSYDNPAVTAIERHLVVPPSRSATQVRVVGSSRGGVTPDAWTWQWIGDRALTQSCGFDSTGAAPVLRPLGDEGLLCQIDSARFVFAPADAELYAGAIDASTQGRIRLPLNNRGCDGTCGGDRVSRLTLSDGSWIDLSVRRAPLASAPLLSGGQIVGGRPDQWVIDPEPPVSVIPSIRPRVVSEFPSLDLMAVRVDRDAADPQHAMRLTWAADRTVRVQFEAQAIASDLAATTCRSTWVADPVAGASGQVVLPGLCAGTGYRFSVTLTDPATGKATVYTTASAASTPVRRVVNWRSEGVTASPPVPADYAYDWTLALTAPGGGRWARFTSLDVRFGSGLLVSSDAAACRPLGGVIAGGSARPETLGQLLAWVEYSASVYDNVDCSGTPTLASGSLLAVVHWLGTEPTTVTLTNAGGWTGALGLRRAS